MQDACSKRNVQLAKKVGRIISGIPFGDHDDVEDVEGDNGIDVGVELLRGWQR